MFHGGPLKMRWHYGNYPFPENTIRSAVTLDNAHNDIGGLTESTWRVRLSGVLLGDSAAAIVAARIAMTNALSVPRQNLVLRGNSNEIIESYTNAASTSGVQVKRLAFPEGVDGFEYVTGRTFEVEFEVVYGRVTGPGGVQLLTFTETVETFGGGPVTGFMRPVNAQPMPVTLYSHSVFEASQIGTAVCLLGYWPVPRPVMGVPIEAPRIGRTCDGKQFTTNWSYRFQSVRPMVGLPTIIR